MWNSNLTKIAAITALSFSINLTTIPAANAAYWAPHIGVDYKYWNVRAANRATAIGNYDYQPLFPKISSSGNFYIGSRVNGYFGFDVGYEQSKTKEGSVIFDGNQAFFGDVENAGDSSKVDLRLKAWHLDLNFYRELWHRIDFYVMGGLATMKPDTKILYTQAGNLLELNQSTRSKWLARVGFGLQYNPVPCIGIKGLVMFDQTSRLNYLGTDEDGNPFDIKPYKNSTSLHLGAVYSLKLPWRGKYRHEDYYDGFRKHKSDRSYRSEQGRGAQYS